MSENYSILYGIFSTDCQVLITVKIVLQKAVVLIVAACKEFRKCRNGNSFVRRKQL